MNEQHHYTACGLDYVYLANGFTMHETPYGLGVSIEDADGLHEAIARDIISNPRRIRGQELRFLRAQLDLTQAGLGKVLGTSRGSIARWESNASRTIPPAADRAMRLFYAVEACGQEVAQRLIEVLIEIDESECQPAVFRESEGQWIREAA